MIDIKYKAKSKHGKKWISSDSIQKIPIFGGLVVSLYTLDDRWVEINQDTLCIYTGKKDMGGVELYSGDKISEHNVIEFNIESGFSINGDRPLHLYKNIVFHGNIHDNEENVEHHG